MKQHFLFIDGEWADTFNLTHSQAQQIVNNQSYVDAVIQYRRDPINVGDRTYSLAQIWITAERVLAQG